MAYLGPPPSQKLATPTSQYFSGNGSTTAFTLNRPVNVAEDLNVFVNNVAQQPGSGKSYTATGTTLTFDAAPDSGTNNVYVVYRGLAEPTTRLEHPSGQPLAATTGTFSGAFTSPGIDDNADATAITIDSSERVGIGTSSPRSDLEIANSAGGELTLKYIGNSGFAAIKTDNSNQLLFCTNATSFTERMRIDSSGRVTTPAQPSFSATGTWTYDSSKYWKGFSTIDHNIGSHWNNTTGTWTCPINGRYFIYASVHHSTISTYHLWAFVKNGGAFNGWVQDYNGSSSGENTTASMCVINCAATDTLRFISNATYPNAYLGGNYTVIGIYLVS